MSIQSRLISTSSLLLTSFIQAAKLGVNGTSDKPKSLADDILENYYPFKLISPFPLKADPTDPSTDDQDDDNSSSAEDIEKWLLIGFCSICIIAMIVCIVVLIVYKIRKAKREREEDELLGSMR